MANWTAKQVTEWLKENGFKKYIKIFEGNYFFYHLIIVILFMLMN